jgi:hypothetical protein
VPVTAASDPNNPKQIAPEPDMQAKWQPSQPASAASMSQMIGWSAASACGDLDLHEQIRNKVHVKVAAVGFPAGCVP